MIHPKFNSCTVRDGIAYIELTQGQVALIDEADLPLVMAHRWCAHKSAQAAKFYAATYIRVGEKRQYLRMHNAILSHVEGHTIDHISRDGLDNRRSNLRYATPAEQCQNRSLQNNSTSGHRGISWFKRTQKWRAQTQTHGKNIHLGYHDTLDAAVAARAAWDEAHNIPPATLPQPLKKVSHDSHPRTTNPQRRPRQPGRVRRPDWE